MGLSILERPGKGVIFNMVKVIGVRFRTAGKVYFFDPLQFEIKRGDNVIVETARGIEFGTVVSDIREMEEDSVVQPLKPVLRLASQRDKDQEAGNKRKEKEAFQICQEKIRKHGLEMKLIDVEYTFDNNKVLFYFTADGRIDFRELVKDLAGVFKTRIELRQIGVRDETKILGGIGICGRPLCCHSYLSDFIPVSIKMAKEQNLSLNPTKISGVCGRLMCCLKNEEDTYEELNKRLPNVGDQVTTEDGQRGEVQSVNVLRQLVKVLIEDGDSKELKEYEADKLRFRRHHSKKDRQNLSPEELAELERLEKVDVEELETVQDDSGRKEEKTGRPERQKNQNSENRERRGRQERGERQEKGNRQSHGERTDKNRSEKGGRGRRPENMDGAEDSQQRQEHDIEKKYRRDYDRNRHRQDRGEHSHQEKGERQNRGGRSGSGEGRQKSRSRAGRQDRFQGGQEASQSGDNN